MTPSQLWYAAAVLLFILEIITPGFVLANFAVAALAAGITAELDGTLYWQVGVFLVTTVVSAGTIRPLLRRARPSSDVGHASDTDALLGRAALVTQMVTSDGTQGYVLVDNTSWRAVSLRATELHPGTKVRICGIEPEMLVVEEIEER